MKPAYVLLATLAALSALTISTIVIAAPTNEIDTTFYSDANKTTVVGESVLFCTGKHSSWGTSTEYKDVATMPCTGGGPCSPVGCENKLSSPNPSARDR